MPNLYSCASSFSFFLEGSHRIILYFLVSNCIHAASFIGPPLALLPGSSIPSTNTFFQLGYFCSGHVQTISILASLSLSIEHNTHCPSDDRLLDHIHLNIFKYRLKKTSKMLYSAQIGYDFFCRTVAAGYSAAACWFPECS